jgi:hypothetical protein
MGHQREGRSAVSEEKQDSHTDDEIVDDMPDTGGAPCGGIFGASDTTYVTDADAHIVGDAEQS